MWRTPPRPALVRKIMLLSTPSTCFRLFARLLCSDPRPIRGKLGFTAVFFFDTSCLIVNSELISSDYPCSAINLRLIGRRELNSRAQFNFRKKKGIYDKTICPNDQATRSDCRCCWRRSLGFAQSQATTVEILKAVTDRMAPQSLTSPRGRHE